MPRTRPSVEQREAVAEEMFDAVCDVLGEVDTEILYGTDVVEAIFGAAADLDASAVVVTPRGGNRFVRLLTGDVALKLVTENDRPVVVLPDGEGHGSDDGPTETEPLDDAETTDE